MFSFLCGAIVGWIVCSITRSRRAVEVQTVNQSNNVAGGDIVGRDKIG